MCDLLPEPVRARIKNFFIKVLFYLDLKKDRIKLKFWKIKTKIKIFIRKKGVKNEKITPKNNAI